MAPRSAVLGLALLAALALSACGGEDQAPEQPAPEQPPASEVNRFLTGAEASCSAGTERATRLPLPAGRRAVATDAEAMAAVVADVRNQIAEVEPPPELEPEAGAYLDQLAADETLLLEVAEAARTGEDFREPMRRLDESAGQAARELGLQECIAFANVVARTP